MPILVTGAAGFIGFHTAIQLLEQGEEVVGLDDFNSYYDPTLKEDRVRKLKEHSGFSLERIGCQDREAVMDLFARSGFDRVVHLGALATYW